MLAFMVAMTCDGASAQDSSITLPAIAINLADYAAVPISGTTLTGTGGNPQYAARVNFLRQDPAVSDRLWVNDLNGNLYLLGKTSREFTHYLNLNASTASDDFNAAATLQGIFPDLSNAGGYANGFVTFQFSPDFPTTGKFYTVHSERPGNPGNPGPRSVPGFSNAGYTTTTDIDAPGTESNIRHCVLVEWIDSNVNDASFTGTAREVLRVEFNNRIHPMGDLLYIPTDPGRLYIAVGDGQNGEVTDETKSNSLQQTNNLMGKILRIDPAGSNSGNGRYGIPAGNPFSVDGDYDLGDEVWAYGFRNPHRFCYDAVSGKLIATDIGYGAKEEVNIIEMGKNYGWAAREGNLVFTNNDQSTSALPAGETTATSGFTFPPIVYSHSAPYGDAISSGFVYRGTRIPALYGKYIFGDITTGQLFYANFDDPDTDTPGDYDDVPDFDDGLPNTLAPIGVVNIAWDRPDDGDSTSENYTRMFEIVEIGYDVRGGLAGNLPGVGNISGTGRADIRLAVDGAGELYILSKPDGMIRAVVANLTAPVITAQPAQQVVAVAQNAVFTAGASGNPAPTYQWQRDPVGDAATFSNVTNSGSYSGAATDTLTITGATTAMNGDQFRCVAVNPVNSVNSNAAKLLVAASAWHLNHFTPAQIEANDANVIGDNADNDHDDLNNLIESAFNLNPWVSSPNGLPQAELINDGTQLRLQFTKHRPELTYTVEFSNDLVTWDDDVPDDAAFTIVTNGNDVTATYTNGVNARVFMRVIVTGS